MLWRSTPGRVVTYDTLQRRVWNERNGKGADTRPTPVRAFVQEPAAASSATTRPSPSWIFNERGVGYRMAAPGER